MKVSYRLHVTLNTNCNQLCKAMFTGSRALFQKIFISCLLIALAHIQCSHTNDKHKYCDGLCDACPKFWACYLLCKQEKCTRHDECCMLTTLTPEMEACHKECYQCGLYYVRANLSVDFYQKCLTTCLLGGNYCLEVMCHHFCFNECQLEILKKYMRCNVACKKFLCWEEKCCDPSNLTTTHI